MALSWALKRRVSVLVFLAFVFIILAIVVWYATYTPPSCFDKKQNQYLEINLELQKDKAVGSKLKQKLLGDIINNLLIKNSEYKHLVQFIGNRTHPKLVFWPAEHLTHFKPGIKQKWVKK